MMPKLELHFEEMLQGTFNLNELNFLFVFQVNCPGCFVYGIPTVNRLFEEYSKEVNFLGLSTAFEDFEYNNVGNTKALLNSGELIGVTKHYFEKQGYDKYPMKLEFPIAMDALAGENFDLTKAAMNICESNPNYAFWPKFDQNQMQQNVHRYLSSQEKIALTFTQNQMRGTPTFIIFSKEMEILSHQFGHQNINQLKYDLDALLSRNN